MFTSIFPGNQFLFHCGSYSSVHMWPTFAVNASSLITTNHVWRTIYQWQKNIGLMQESHYEWVELCWSFFSAVGILFANPSSQWEAGGCGVRNLSNTAAQKESQETFTTTRVHTFQQKPKPSGGLKVHKIEIFFGFDFEICIISLLVMWKY